MFRNVLLLKVPLPKVSPIISLSLALLAVSFSPIFIRLSETELGPNATSYNRLFIFMTIFGLSRLWGNQGASSLAPTQSVKAHQWGLLVGVGIFSSFALVLWAMSLQYTSVAKSMLLSNLTPLFTTIGSWLVLGRRVDSKFLIGMMIAVGGAVALGFEDLTQTDGHLTGDLYAVMSAGFLGMYFLLVELLRDRFSAVTILLWRCAVGSLLLSPAILLTEDHIFPTTTVAWLAVIGLALVCEGLGQRLLADSMDQFSCGFVSVFLLLEPVLSALLAWIIFVEQLSPMTWVGFVVILSGIYIAKSSAGSEKMIGAIPDPGELAQEQEGPGTSDPLADPLAEAS